MAKAQENRYDSCREFADALREAFGISPYRYGSGTSQPTRAQILQDAQPEREPTFAADPPTHDAGVVAPPQLSDAPTQSRPPPRRPAATPRPIQPVPTPHRPPADRRASRYPPVTGLPWHFVAYLLPILLPTWGMVFVLYLMRGRSRSARMSGILGFEIGVIFNAGLLCGIAAISRNPDPGLFASIFVLCSLLGLGLAIACTVQLCLRKQPEIPPLSDLARRLAYGKARRR